MPAREFSGVHSHACATCRLRYQDACDTPLVDQVCLTCKTGHQMLNTPGFRPRDCCYEQTRPTSREDRIKYGLAGTSEWFQCRTCRRSFPTYPSKTQRTENTA